jgi:V-type H+-transporting ATPase subunit a
MIFYKWGVDWHQRDLDTAGDPNSTVVGTNGAPVLLNELIFMFLPGGRPNNLYDNQVQVQMAMVVMAGISLPWMLAKPCVEYRIHKRQAKKKAEPTTVTVVDIDDDNQKIESSSSASLEDEEVKVDEAPAPKPKPEFAEEEEYQFGESCIHNLLETIEFVLGSVSHTASYLRLWALSLAHSELATVFWDKIMAQLFELTANMHWFIIGLAGFAAFAVWFAITLMVMMFMELLSALLHALRLHWVEFQSKFYKGDGTPFRPFSLRKIHESHFVMHLATKHL